MELKVYTVKAPDGRTIKVKGPVGASQAEVIAQAQKLLGSPQTTLPSNAPAVPATGVQPTPSAQPAPSSAPYDDGTAWMENYDPTQDMSGMERFVTGFDKGVTNLGQGAKQLALDTLGIGDAEARRKEVEDMKRRDQPLTDTGAGMAGNIVGSAVPLLPAAAFGGGAGLLTRVGLGAAEGAATAALAPVSEEGERGENMMWGGGFGGALPVAGAVTRGLVGEVDPALKKAREVLKEYGIGTVRGAQAPGVASRTMDAVTRHIPGINTALKTRSDAKRQAATDALFNMMDEAPPSNNQELLDIINRAGERVGNVTRGKSADLYGMDTQINRVLDQYDNLLPSQQQPGVIRTANELLDLSNSGRPLSGTAYQAIRSDLGAEAATATGARKSALKGLKDALDRKFKETLSPDEVEQLADAEAKYRLANALRNVDVQEGSIDLTKARSAVERKARRGPVMQEARDLLESVHALVPKGNAGITTPGAVGTGLALLNPAFIAKGAALGLPLRGALATGLPQDIASSKTANTLLSRLLRGYTQTELSD
jgi:hypothetical protein